MNTILLILIAIGLFALGYGGAYAYSASKVSIQNVQMDELRSITLQGFSVGGVITIANDGIVGITVKNITYDIILEATNHTLVSGVVQGARIPAKGMAEFAIENQINWVPTATGVLQLLEPGDTYLKITGTAVVSRFNIKIPFETNINIETYLKQFIQEKAESLLDSVFGKLESLFA